MNYSHNLKETATLLVLLLRSSAKQKALRPWARQKALHSRSLKETAPLVLILLLILTSYLLSPS